jgi:hypothetical protein
MSYDVKLSEGQKIEVMKAALESIKDAPLTPDEINVCCRDALRIVNDALYDIEKNPLSPWGSQILYIVCAV